MKTDTIKNEIMLRIREVELLSKLQTLYKLSPYKSVNEFINSILKVHVFKDTREDEIFDKLETIEDTTNAIYEKVKNR